MKRLILNALLGTLLIGSFQIHASDSDTIEKGASVKIGNGWARSFVIYNLRHQPTSVGVEMTTGTLEGLPEVPVMYTLKLPFKKRIQPYKEISIDWNPEGHEPPEIYGLPHFDFHFYFISHEERQAITCMDEDAAVCTLPPAPDLVAPYYIPTPAGVPMMGWHWLDSRSPELNGKKFTSTFIEGYYNGKMIFLEPMITREFLMNKGEVNQKLSLPPKFSAKGYYPKKYELVQEKKAKKFRVVLKNLFKVE